ncbi:MAG: D-alanyl-D-alanine carboxypeptidase [Clostridia bacterium]|nr:D-alanyl-D-alanine carboxypeptidase [Clostridia bacterium]
MTKSKVLVLAVSVILIAFSMVPSICSAKSELCVGKAAILVEASSGRVLYEKNSRQKLPMASTTKIATALTVLEHANLSDMVVVDKRAVGVEGSSVYLREGEKLTVEELLYALMLRSGNDSAIALAIHVGGSVERFVDLMNATARNAGALDTCFVNPHGLHDEGHYTTAFDLALITKCAMSNDEFCKIVSSKSKVISNEGMDYKRNLANKNKLLLSYEYANGVKTGYTKKAGRCFVGSAYKDGMQLIAVVLNCGPMFENAQSMLEFGFSQYTMTNIICKNKVLGAICTNKKATYFACPQGFSYPLTQQEAQRIEREVDLPIDDAGEGKVVVKLGDEAIFESILTKY